MTAMSEDERAVLEYLIYCLTDGSIPDIKVRPEVVFSGNGTATATLTFGLSKYQTEELLAIVGR